jgi:hypothetical protein
MKKIFTFIILLGIANVLQGQTTLVGPEAFGSGLGVFTATNTWTTSVPSSTSAGSGGAAASVLDNYLTTTYLNTSSFSTTGMVNIDLEFYEWQNDGGFSTGHILIEYSTNGGANWNSTSFTSSATDLTNSTLKTFRLPTGAENQASLMVRFAFSSTGDDFGSEYYLDDFEIVGTTPPITNFYNISGSNLTLVASWGTNTDGTGSNPSNFTTNNQVFNVKNGTTATVGAWTVSGSNSKVIVGDGSSSMTLTLSSTLTGTVDVLNNATLDFALNPNNTTFGNLSTGSTVRFSRSGSQTVKSASFYNLTLAGSGAKTITTGTIVNNTFNTGSISGTVVLGTLLTLNGTITGNTPLVSTSSRGITINKTGGGSVGTLVFDASSNSINSITVSSGDVTLGSNITLAGTTPTIVVSTGASFDAGSFVIDGTGSTEVIDVIGTIKTSNLNGFSAGSNTTFTTNVSTPLLASTSNVMYNASSGTQIVTPFPEVSAYANVELAGAATKAFSADDYYISGDFVHAGGTATINASAEFFFEKNGDQAIAALAYPTVTFSGSGNKTLSSTDSTRISKSLTVEESAVVVTGGKLVLQSVAGSSSAVILDSTASANGISGNVMVKRYLPAKASNNGGATPPAWFFSSPVYNTSLYSFSPVNLNIYQYINSNSAGQRWALINPSTSVISGKGYLVRSYSSKTNYFYGPVRSGDVSIGITTAGDAWNLIGNPYPSRIIWDDVSGQIDMTNIGASQNCKIYISGTNGYSIIAADPNNEIALGQGFFVQASGNGDVVFKNASRTLAGSTLMRQESAFKNRLAMYVKKHDMSDMAVIHIHDKPAFSNKYDAKYDGTKIFPSSTVPSIYMPKEGKEVDIYSFGVSESNVKIPLHVKLPKDTVYKLEFADIEKIAPEYNIYLMDSVGNNAQDLRENATYEFSSVSGVKTRFALVFSKLPTDISKTNFMDELVSIYSNSGMATISTSSVPRSIQVADVTGKEVYRNASFNSNTSHISLSNCKSGMYIATIELGSRVVYKKFMLNN